MDRAKKFSWGLFVASLVLCTVGLISLLNQPPQTVLAQAMADPCQTLSVAKQFVAVNITSAVTTQLVAPSGSKAIYVCGGSFTIPSVSTTATTMQFEYGTGGTCGTGTTVMTGQFNAGNVTAGPAVPITLPGDYVSMFTPASQGLCLVSAGSSVSIQGVLNYVQQ